MMNILLKKNNLFKLLLMSQFSKAETNYSISDLLTNLKIDSSKLKKQVALLNDDLDTLFDNELHIIKSKDNYYLKSRSKLYTVQILENLKVYYLEQSTTFAIIQAMLRKNFYSIEELAGELHLTTSYIYKQLIQLGQILKPLGIELTFTQEYGESNFLGKEEILRYFIFSFYWSSYKTSRFPEQRTVLDESKVRMDNLDQYVTSSSDKQHLRYYIAYSIYRAIDKKKGIELDGQFIQLATLLQQTNDLSIYDIDRFPSDLSAILTNENLFFNFVIRTFIAIDTEEEQVMLAKQFLATDLPLCNLSELFLQAIISHWQLSIPEKDYYVLIYLSVLIQLFIRYIGISFYDTFNYSELLTFDTFPAFVPKDTFDEIKQFHQSFLKDYPLAAELTFKTKYEYIVYTWVYQIIDYKKHNKLKIAVHFSKDPLTELFIKNKIYNLYCEDSIQFIADSQHADLVISDFSEPSVSKENLFFLENIFDQNLWYSPFNFIQKKLFDKNFL